MNRCRLSTVAANAATDAVTSLLAGGRLELFAGPQPASPEEPVKGQTRVMQISLGSPAFGRAEEGQAQAKQTWESEPAEAAGQIGWFRAYAKSGQPVLDGSVGEDTKSDLVLNDATVKAGTILFVRAFTFTAARKGD